MQAFPNEPILLQYEADLATILKNKERVCDSLEKAFIANPRNSNIGIRLAKLYKDIQENDKAIQVLDARTLFIYLKKATIIMIETLTENYYMEENYLFQDIIRNLLKYLRH